jgi:hypothetical protein
MPANASTVSDFSQFWDISAAYCPQLFPNPSASLPIFDYLTHIGDFKAVVGVGPSKVTAILHFNGFNNLNTTFAPVGFTFNYDNSTHTGSFSPGGVQYAFTDLTTNFVYSYSSQNAPPNKGHFLNVAGGIFNIGVFFNRDQRLVPTTNPTDYNYYNYTFDGTNYSLAELVTATVNNGGYAFDTTDTGRSITYYVTDPPQVIENIINTIPNTIFGLQGLTFGLTNFGPQLTWKQSYPLNANTPYDQLVSILFLGVSPASVTLVNSSIVVKRQAQIGAGFPSNLFPPLPSPPFPSGTGGAFSPWHYPRQPRVYSTLRQVSNITDSDPWVIKKNPVDAGISLVSATVAQQ